MNFLLTFLFFTLCFFGMAVGLIFAKKILKKGCSTDPESCACKKEEELRTNELKKSDPLLGIQPSLKNKNS